MTKKVIVVSGFSGSGKGTMIKRFLVENDGYELTKSYTTREKRNADDFYHFVSLKEFMSLKKSNCFLESNQYAGHWYGTLREDLEAIADRNKIPILEIDANGFEEVSNSGIEADIFSVFIYVDPGTLKERLLRRDGDIRGTIQRLEVARRESRKVHNYQFSINNQDIAHSLKQLQTYLDGRITGGNKFDDKVFRKEVDNVLIDLYGEESVVFN